MRSPKKNRGCSTGTTQISMLANRPTNARCRIEGEGPMFPAQPTRNEVGLVNFSPSWPPFALNCTSGGPWSLVCRNPSSDTATNSSSIAGCCVTLCGETSSQFASAGAASSSIAALRRPYISTRRVGRAAQGNIKSNSRRTLPLLTTTKSRRQVRRSSLKNYRR